MGGSLLKLTQNSKANSHSTLVGREEMYQHPLTSIYRESDGESLSTILKQIQEKERAVVYDCVEITQDTTVVNFPNLSYNVTKDVLLVFCGGAYVYEGTDKDYIKSSSNSITFNFTLKPGMHVLAIIGGTLSSESYGDDISSMLTRFTQLADTLSTYHGNENKFLMVNEQGTGIVACCVKASHDLHCFEFEADVDNGYEISIPFPNSCYITGIKFTPKNTEDLSFEVQLLESDGTYIYSSGNVLGVLWDIMKIPCILKDSSIIVKVFSNLNCNFKVQLYYEL